MLNVLDILTDEDLLAYDARCREDFGNDSTLAEKRVTAVTEWLPRRLEPKGYPIDRHRIRREPDRAFTLTSGVYTDATTDLSTLAGSTSLGSICLTPSTDAILIGYRTPPRGLYVNMLDLPNSAPLIASYTYWNGGQWKTLGAVDRTKVLPNSISFMGGGLVSWRLPEDWQVRPIGNSSPYLYWTRIQFSALPTPAATVHQILPVQRSRLTDPAAYYALSRLYLEGMGGSRGEWQEKGEQYDRIAEAMLQDVIEFVRDEFDIDESEAVSRDEVNSILPDIGGFVWERG